MIKTEQPLAVMMIGGPAAGKSTVIERDYSGMKVVDCDQFKPLIPGYDPKNITEEVHVASAILGHRALFAALAEGKSFVYDSTGTNAEKMVSIIAQAQAAGFETLVVYVTCSLSTAIARNAARPRTVPESILRSKHALVATSFAIVSQYADRVAVVNNN